jgi:hypothetical protein
MINTETIVYSFYNFVYMAQDFLALGFNCQPVSLRLDPLFTRWMILLLCDPII